MFKSFCLMLHSLLDFILDGSFTGNGFLLHSSLHFLKFVLKVSLLGHEQLIVAVFCQALIMAKLCLHAIGESFQSLFIFES